MDLQSELLSDLGVVTFLEEPPNFLSTTAKPEEIYRALSDIVSQVYHDSQATKLFVEGLQCEVMHPQSNGWIKGKVRISLEFTPNEDEGKSVFQSLQTIVQSPLDELRNTLD
jgi:KGK domain